jgi:hypothetical protein
MKTRIHKAAQAGYTLLTTLMLTGCITAMVAATLTRTLTEAKLNDRDNDFQAAGAAAEAATEKVLSRMLVDFRSGGESLLSNNLSIYRAMVPTTNENSYWTNFLFSDGNGNNNATYVERTTTAPNPPYVMLEQQYPGLNAFASTYRILSDAQYTNCPYNLTGVVQQDIQMAEIPVFQWAIFYNGLLEFSDCATMVVNGRVHCNTNINVGCQSSSTLTFNNYDVTATGIITNPAAGGISQGNWVSANTIYNGTPAPGYGTGQPFLTLPIGTNSASPTSVREIINPPPAGESTTNPISPQRFYNKAFMVILITNAFVPNGASQVAMTNPFFVNLTNSVTVLVKNSMYDASPLTNAVTNAPGLIGGPIINGVNYQAAWTNWTNTGITNWLCLTNTFLDQRQGTTNHVVQIDVGKLCTWIGNSNGICTNSLLTGKWNTNNPFNGVIYVQDQRYTNSFYMNCVRLTNGQNITNGLNGLLYVTGLTVATQNPLYIQGLYNCPGATAGTANVSGCPPASVVCDALTILSPSWSDAKSFNTSGASVSASSSDTVNAAIIAGNVPTTGTSATQFSGGVHNLTRLLEDWSSSSLWLNTSIINLYPSAQATAQFQMPGAYYNPPTRHFSFNSNYTNSTGLPPGTPLIDLPIRADWGIAPPNVVNFYSPTLDFVAH